LAWNNQQVKLFWRNILAFFETWNILAAGDTSDFNAKFGYYYISMQEMFHEIVVFKDDIFSYISQDY